MPAKRKKKAPPKRTPKRKPKTASAAAQGAIAEQQLGEVAALVGDGYSTAEIAARLRIGPLAATKAVDKVVERFHREQSQYIASRRFLELQKSQSRQRYCLAQLEKSQTAFEEISRTTIDGKVYQKVVRRTRPAGDPRWFSLLQNEVDRQIALSGLTDPERMRRELMSGTQDQYRYVKTPEWKEEDPPPKDERGK